MKLLLFSDLHIGKKQDNDEFLQLDLRVIATIIEIVKKENIDMIIFLGDFVDKRSAYTPKTIMTALSILNTLDNLKIPVYFIVGNHDLFYKNNRELHFFKPFKMFYNNIQIIDEVSLWEDFCFVPWLMEEEKDKVKEFMNESKFVFGHFEFADVPLHGSYYSKGIFKKEDFKDTLIYSGHFHNPYKKDNLTYIGSPYAFDFGHTSNHYGIFILDVDNGKLKKENFWAVAGPRFLVFEEGKEKKIVEDNNYYIAIKGNKQYIKKIMKELADKKNVTIVRINEQEEKEEINLEEDGEDFIDFSDVLNVLLKVVDEVITDSNKATRLKEKIRKIAVK